MSKGYAPLEQGRDGDVSQFGPSTDIYALGATLYYLLSGVVPPEASVVNEDGLERPEGISDRMWAVIERSMRPRRKDRPQGIGEFLALLEAGTGAEQESGMGGADDDETAVARGKTSGGQIPPTPPSTPAPSPKPKVKAWLWALLGGIAAAAAVAALVLNGGGRHAVPPYGLVL